LKILKVLVVVGTRPEVIKMGPVVRALSENSHNVSFKVCVTSQHREMAEEALRIFDIHPDYDLNVMTGDQTPTQVAAAVLERIEPVLRSEEPDWVLVQGDTTSVTAASLAAFYCRVRVGHVEAGLRTHNRLHPFPEEVHRRIVGTTADLHFAPTARARSELLKEGVAENDIVLTGNPIVDAVQWWRRCGSIAPAFRPAANGRTGKSFWSRRTGGKISASHWRISATLFVTLPIIIKTRLSSFTPST